MLELLPAESFGPCNLGASLEQTCVTSDRHSPGCTPPQGTAFRQETCSWGRTSLPSLFFHVASSFVGGWWDPWVPIPTTTPGWPSNVGQDIGCHFIGEEERYCQQSQLGIMMLFFFFFPETFGHFLFPLRLGNV